MRRWLVAGSLALVTVLAGAVPAVAEEPPVEAGVAPGAQPPDPRPGEAFASPEIATLQRTAGTVQRELTDLTGRIEGARAKLRTADAELRRATSARKRADAVVAARQDEVDRYSGAVFSALGQPNEVRLFLVATSERDFLDGAQLITELRDEQQRRLTSAVNRQSAAQRAEQAARGARQVAANRSAQLERSVSDARGRAEAVSSELRGQLADADAAVRTQQREQQRLNQRTAANWRGYLDRLSAAGIQPPAAADLADPARLPAGLTPVPGADGTAQRGIARATNANGQRLLVLPKETLDAVSKAMDALGKPYVPGATGSGPTAYSCDGLTSTVYREAGLAVPDTAAAQLAEGVPVRRTDAQPGDLIFLGPERYGVQSVGILLDGRSMLVADASRANVVVRELPGKDTVLGFTRPSLGNRDAAPVPEATDGGLRWRCGSVLLPARLADGGAEPADSAGSAAPATAGAWSGYPNGLIPSTSLCQVATGHLLRCDAAQAYLAMSEAYAGRFGQPLCITDSYRTYTTQTELYARKPGLAAVPGTSNHGWALAVDLCGGIESFGSAQHGWMRANAGTFGWVNPDWARPGGGREEPWHWEFAG
ncbi:D-alanyl-D-alanine carboxypeptidase-like protein [Tamaricihabitans halophyticus]|uniref:D-alanyl-D-alanine carboxypeptidase-like protein n=1 Tax=Tamaricihabitans halophyticus TaxID=1262583 RepID=A0A4R2R097_9PSEU|nr:NlpC/P60 family protein [Tamaricihabitans halophyticus]TCP55104.1 D-alanyl-D-alanine carboxypeptidase-like protein [Tamaricihabitans halophyticus]